MKTASRLLAFVSFLLTAAAAPAQTTTGTLSGQVSDAGNLPVPGVTVTLQSPRLQGQKTAPTPGNGDERGGR